MMVSIKVQSFEHQWAYHWLTAKNAAMMAMKMRSFIGSGFTCQNLEATTRRRLIKMRAASVKKVLRWRKRARKTHYSTRAALICGTPNWKISHATTYALPQMSMMVW